MPKVFAERKCVICTKPFTPKGAAQKACPGECQEINRINKFNERDEKRRTKKCNHCGEDYISVNGKKHCTKKMVKCEGCGIDFKTTIYRPAKTCGNLSCRGKVSNANRNIEKEQEERLKKTGYRHNSQTPEFKEKFTKTMLERYDAAHPSQSPELMEKKKKNALEKWGVEHPIAAPEIREKVKQKNLELYGVEYPASLPEIRAKAQKTQELRDPGFKKRNAKNIETNLKKRGVANPMQDPEIKKKSHQKIIENHGGILHGSPEISKKITERIKELYGVENPGQAPEIKTRIKETVTKRTVEQKEKTRQQRENTIFKKYGETNVMRVEEFKQACRQALQEAANNGENPNYNRVSKLNRRFAEKLMHEFNLIEEQIQFEVPFGKTYSADLGIFLNKNNSTPDLLIEINPTVSHNTELSFTCIVHGCKAPCSKHKTIDVSYHVTKARTAMEKDLSLLQIYDWDDEAAIIKFIGGKLNQKSFQKYSARKLTLKSITQKQANDFLKLHHIQGAGKEQKYCYGLFTSNDELLVVGTFSKSRYNKAAKWEFNRYAVKTDTVVHGAVQRIFKEFLKEVNPESIISYLDFDHSTRKETFLNSLGFTEITSGNPTLNWSNPVDGRHYSNNALLKVGADRLLKTNYGGRETAEIGNREIMLLEGFLPVYNSGNRVFIWRK